MFRIRSALAAAAAVALGGSLLSAPSSAAPASGTSAPTLAQEERARPQCLGARATNVGTNGDDELRGTNRRDVIVAGGGDDTVIAVGGDDLICGNGGDDIILAGAGRDAISGGGGFDIILAQAGVDRYNGGAGIDLAAFLDAKGGVRVDLARGRSSGAEQDRFRSMEAGMGSGHRDVITGSAGINAFFGTGGRDVLAGGGGQDFVFYTNDKRGRTINLTTGRTSHGQRLSGIENASGTRHADTLVGASGRNMLNGWKGRDLADGRAGSDTCLAERRRNCDLRLPTTAGQPPTPGGPPPGARMARLGDLPLTMTAPPANPDRASSAPTSSSGRATPPSYSCPQLAGGAWVGLPSWPGYMQLAVSVDNNPFVYYPWVWSYGNGAYAAYAPHVGAGDLGGGWWSMDDRMIFLGNTGQSWVETHLWYDGEWLLMGGCRGSTMHLF